MKHGSLWPTINTISNNNRGKLMDIISSQQKNKAQGTNTVSAAKSATKKKFLKVTSFRAMLVITIVAVLFGIWSMIGFNMESLYPNMGFIIPILRLPIKLWKLINLVLPKHLFLRQKIIQNLTVLI